MSEYRIAAKIPRDHLWYGGYFRDLILEYFELDGSDLTDECQLCYDEDFITHTYIFSPVNNRLFGRLITDWDLDWFGNSLCRLNNAENPITPRSHVVRHDSFSYEIVIETVDDSM